MDHPVINVMSGSPEAPIVTAFVMSPVNLAEILREIIAAEPQAVIMYNQLAPIAATLPAPWNVIANPLVKQAVAALPTLLPVLQNIEAILERIGQVLPPQENATV